VEEAALKAKLAELDEKIKEAQLQRDSRHWNLPSHRAGTSPESTATTSRASATNVATARSASIAAFATLKLVGDEREAA
jgi:hypothetical protein